MFNPLEEHPYRVVARNNCLFFVPLALDSCFFAHIFCNIYLFSIKFEMKVHVLVANIKYFFSNYLILVYYFKIAPNWMSTLVTWGDFSTIV